MNILFVYTRELAQSPVKPLTDLEAIQFGISYISSVLKNAGHNTRLLVMTRSSDFQVIDNYLERLPTQLVCFTSVASEFAFVVSIAKHIKNIHPGIYRLAGGPHVSLNAADEMFDVFDSLCIGEGEQATLELAGQLGRGEKPSDIPNLWIKTDSGIQKNPTVPFIQNLDEVPYPDRGMWDEWIDFDRSPMRPSLLIGRGCPFECSYCCNHALKGLADGKYVRLRSPENIVGEIKDVLEKYKKVREFYFEVETLGIDLNWVRGFCEKLRELNANRQNPISFGANLRVCPPVVKNVDGFMDDLKRSNFRFLHIGLESGSERVRSEVLRRHYTNDDFLKVVSAAKSHGFQVILFNLIGLPNETVADFRMTVEANRQANPDWYYLSIFFPYPGTDIYNLCAQLKAIPQNILSTDKERVKARMDFPTFSRSRIQKAFICFDYYVFRGKKPLDWLADRVLDKYRMIYSGRERLFILWFILCDFLLPSRSLGPGYQESHLYGMVLCKYIKNQLLLFSDFFSLLLRFRPTARVSKETPLVAAAGRPLQVDLLEEYIKRTWEFFGTCGKGGRPWKIAIYGAGSHTAWLCNIVSKAKLTASPTIVAILDDNPQPERKLWGMSPVKPEEFDPETVDGILLSSDVFAEKMRSKLHLLYKNKCIYLNIYENLPPGPYPKGN